MIKYLISDMDHTILQEDGSLDTQTIMAIRQSPVQVSLASARNPHSMMKFIHQLGLLGPQLALNGALIFQAKGGKIQILQERLIDKKVAERIQSDLRQFAPEVDFTWITKDHWYIPQMTKQMRIEMSYSGVQPVVGKQLKATPAPGQIAFIIKDHQLFRSVKKHLQQQFSNLIIQSSGDGYLTINSAGTSKGTLVDYLLEHGVDRHQIAGIGDDQNDLPLLKAVGYPLAVANAVPSVKEHAQQVVPSNQDDGIAKFLSSLPNEN